MKLKDIYLLAGTICWLISLLSFSFKYPARLKIFSLFLFFSIVIEWSAWFIGRYMHQNNTWLYNIYSIIEFVFLTNFFLQKMTHKNVKIAILVFSIAYPVVSILNMLFWQGLYTFNTYTYFIGSLFMVFIIIYFFKELTILHENVDLAKDPFFFIGVGYLLFYTIEIPYTVMLPYFAIDKELGLYFIWILKILNIIMYGFLSIAFLCKLKTQK